MKTCPKCKATDFWVYKPNKLSNAPQLLRERLSKGKRIIHCNSCDTWMIVSKSWKYIYATLIHGSFGDYVE